MKGKVYTYRDTMHACYLGYVTQAINNNLAPLLFVVFQDQFHISLEMIGSLILMNFVTQIVVDLLAVRFVDRMGYRMAAALAHIASAAGLVLLAVLPHLLDGTPFVGLCIAAMTYAVGGGLTEVIISPIADSLPGEQKAASMSLLHSFYCWGQIVVVLLSTLFIRILGSRLWYLLPLLWALLPLGNLFYFLRVPLMPTIPDNEKTPLKQLFASRIFLLAMVMMVCAGASELAMSQWASLFAEKGLHVSKLMGDLLGPCLFAVFMALSRTAFGVWGARWNLRRILILSALLGIACYLITALSPIPVLSLLGCALCGLAVSLMGPGLFSLTAAVYPKGGTAMFGVLAVMGDVGCSVGPWLSGLVSDRAQQSQAILQLGASFGFDPQQTGLRAGMLAAVIFPLIMATSLLFFRRRSEKELDA